VISSLKNNLVNTSSEVRSAVDTRRASPTLGISRVVRVDLSAARTPPLSHPSPLPPRPHSALTSTRPPPRPPLPRSQLLIAKGQIDELNRDKKKLSSQLAEQSAEAAAAATSQSSAAVRVAEARNAELTSTITKLNVDVRTAGERAHSLEEELTRERNANAALRAAAAQREREVSEAARDSAARARTAADALAAVRAELNDCKTREIAATRDREELQVRFPVGIFATSAARAR
jgi:DNA repair exonuclease SbcCD ATPase subunit